jgi:hypothetical protein
MKNPVWPANLIAFALTPFLSVPISQHYARLCVVEAFVPNAADAHAASLAMSRRLALSPLHPLGRAAFVRAFFHHVRSPIKRRNIRVAPIDEFLARKDSRRQGLLPG